MSQTPIRWTPAEAFAAADKPPSRRVIVQILDGQLNGVVIDSDWYVIDFEDDEEKDPARATVDTLQ